MKGALACYVEAVRALQDAGVRLKGDVLIAAVVGEIEKTQWGDEFRGKEYRGYAAGSRYLVTHGGVADMCILGEPTEGGRARPLRLDLDAHVDARQRSCTRRSAAAAPRRTRSCGCARCSTPCSSGSRSGRTTGRRYGGKPGRRQRRLDPRRVPLARLADARAGPTSSSTCACRRRCRWRTRARRCSPTGCARSRSASPTTGSTGRST